MENKVSITSNKWQLLLTFKVLPLLFLIIAFKFVVYYNGWDILYLNLLFTSLVAGTIFLTGFLISGALFNCKNKNFQTVKEFLEFRGKFADSIIKWLYKKEGSKNIMEKISRMND